MEVLSPTPPRDTSRVAPLLASQPVDSLDRAVILSNDWPAMEIMADAMEHHLAEAHGVRSIVRDRFPTAVEMPAVEVDRAAASGDLVILGVAS